MQGHLCAHSPGAGWPSCRPSVVLRTGCLSVSLGRFQKRPVLGLTLHPGLQDVWELGPKHHCNVEAVRVILTSTGARKQGGCGPGTLQLPR